jgi:hypothetical protein
MVLKAQSQCRTTIEALDELKHPKSTFIKQQKCANQQQVNNGAVTSTSVRVHEKDITPPNELLRSKSARDVGRREKGSANRLNSKLEIVGAFNGAKH